MNKTSYAESLLDPRWQRKRLEILNRDNFTCQLCDSTKYTLHVHHKGYYGNAWDTPSDELVTYCKYCHKVVEFIKKNYPAFAQEVFIIAIDYGNRIEYYLKSWNRSSDLSIYITTSDGDIIVD